MFDFTSFRNSFKNPEFLEQALTHSSFLHENAMDDGSYERLEFLGDSILGFVCTDLLNERCPELDEGQMSRLKSIFVSEVSLAERARKLGLGLHLRLGKGERLSGGASRPSILADVVESVLAAVYLDQGLNEAKAFLRKSVFPEWSLADSSWDTVVAQQLQKDSKSRLQEIFQRKSWGLPRYVCLNAETAGSKGPFEMAILVDDTELARTLSSSKKEGTLQLATSLLAMGLPKLVASLQNLGLIAEAKTHDLGLSAVTVKDSISESAPALSKRGDIL